MCHSFLSVSKLQGNRLSLRGRCCWIKGMHDHACCRSCQGGLLDEWRAEKTSSGKSEWQGYQNKQQTVL